MQTLSLNWTQPHCRRQLSDGLQEILRREQELVWLCIGTDKQIADSLGPLVGSMLKRSQPEIKALGSLEAPVHAKNLRPQVRALLEQYPAAKVIAVDAAAGAVGEIGLIRLREGGLLPGRALAKNLPAVGDYALTAVVQSSRHFRAGTGQHSLAFIYRLAEIIAGAAVDSYRNHKNINDIYQTEGDEEL